MSAELAARRTAAAAVLADYRAAVASAPLTNPPGREWMLRLASVLGDLLVVLGAPNDDEDQAAEDAAMDQIFGSGTDTRRLAEIRALLARFDWEHDDRQYALEAIERIADGGQS